MNSVPGFPFTFSIAQGNYDLQVFVDSGTLCKWDKSTWIVSDCGRETVCGNGETLYWSPLSGDSEGTESAVITVFALENGKKVASQQISITCSGNLYYAKVGQPGNI